MKTFVLAAVSLIAAPTLAQTMPAKVQTRAEFVARTQRMFAMLDVNHDSVLDQAELAAAGKRWDGSADKAGGRDSASGQANGRMPLDRNAMFDMIDTNHDGAISRDEFARAPMHHGDTGMKGGHPAMGGGMRHGMGGGMARMWTMADANHDGRVTLQEAIDLAQRHFDRMDANHDGQLAPEEWEAGRAHMESTRAQ